MAHKILAIMLRYLLWIRETLDAVGYAITMPTEGGPIATDVFASKSVFSRALRLPTAKEIWEAKTLTAGTLLGLVIILVVRYARSPWRKVPPSPRRLPIIGNTLQMMNKPWLLSKDCKERFGESLIICSKRLGRWKLQARSCILTWLDSLQSCLIASNQPTKYSSDARATTLIDPDSSWRRTLSVMVYYSR